MSDELSKLSERELIIKTNGVLKGDKLSVAAVILDGDSRSVLADLKVNNKFYFGNRVPMGTIVVTNDEYDPQSGIYWFDVKVTPVNQPGTYVFDTYATLGTERFNIRFEVAVQGQSRATVENLQFTGEFLTFNVRADSGKILRSPLSTLLTRNLGEQVTPKNTTDNTVAYAWQTTINPDSPTTFALIGQVMIDSSVEPFMVRITPEFNAGLNLSMTQTGKNTVKIAFVLKETPKGNVVINTPIQYGPWDGVPHGVSNIVENLTVEGRKVSFDLPIMEVEGVSQLVAHFSAYDSGTQYRQPILMQAFGNVSKWNDNGKEVIVKVLGHAVKNGTERASFELNWDTGYPVTGFQATCPADANGMISGNTLLITRRAPKDVREMTQLTINGFIDLSVYGVEEQVPYTSTIDYGSDVIPARTQGAAATVDQDKVVLFISVTQNNGKPLDTVTVDSVRATREFGDVIRYQSYDADQGILQLTLDKLAVSYPSSKSKVELELAINDKYKQKLSVPVEIQAEFKLNMGVPEYQYTSDAAGNVSIMVKWVIKGPDGNAPESLTLRQLRFNGRDIPYTKRYDRGNGILTLIMSPNFVHNETFVLMGLFTVSGSSNFESLPTLSVKYRTPAAVELVDSEIKTIDGIRKLELTYDVTDWSSNFPVAATVDPAAWTQLRGLAGNPYTLYDPQTGKLVVRFNILGSSDGNFTGQNTLMVNNSSTFTMPISFVLEESTVNQ